MPVVDESIVEQQWAELTETERAFERLSSSDLYRKWIMITYFRRELRAYDINTDPAYSTGAGRWISAIEREEMQDNPMRKT